MKKIWNWLLPASRKAQEGTGARNPLDPQSAQIIADAKFAVKAYECGMGNLILIVERADLLFRFVQDRGYCTCEISSRKMEGIWIDYVPACYRLLTGTQAYQSDMPELVRMVLGRENGDSIDRLSECTSDTDLFRKLQKRGGIY